jgi:hypothetical protein
MNPIHAFSFYAFMIKFNSTLLYRQIEGKIQKRKRNKEWNDKETKSEREKDGRKERKMKEQNKGKGRK